jgi:hypothetical protein
MVSQIASSLIDSLKSQPLVLALVALNVIFLVALWFVFKEIASSVERKDDRIVQLIEKCFGGRK